MYLERKKNQKIDALLNNGQVSLTKMNRGENYNCNHYWGCQFML